MTLSTRHIVDACSSFREIWNRTKEDEDEIISQASLEVVKDVILLLKQHSREEGLFRRSGEHVIRQRVLESLKKGERLQVPSTPDSAKECAAALQLYLTQMRPPVVPKRVQQLLIADNPGISVSTIANDALGLIRQDVIGRHNDLLVNILMLLRHLLIFSPASERTELQAPPVVMTFLPVFFELSTDDALKWRQIASRFNEVIIEAPKQLTTSGQLDVGCKEITGHESNIIVRLRALAMINPFLRFAQNRNSYDFEDRMQAQQLRRPLIGRLHPAIIRERV
ncbi:hypothetical protein QAD02_015627 [Eretmocerus hayati]|uniref:Uncharacterized protein n=1 Tax=Eretmocerus hayati TaxID=131215 RepID=A0ACC2P8C0_9HYME|nr:hypothetical protein QAD02_015627 [Eretmocerus hayati]